MTYNSCENHNYLLWPLQMDKIGEAGHICSRIESNSAKHRKHRLAYFIYKWFPDMARSLNMVLDLFHTHRKSRVLD